MLPFSNNGFSVHWWTPKWSYFQTQKLPYKLCKQGGAGHGDAEIQKTFGLAIELWEDCHLPVGTGTL
jgi:hypothetical protein